jgi:ATP-binding protein involved in chromosome partitioning
MGAMPAMPTDTLVAAVRTALDTVLDPEIRRPITELGMVRSVDVEARVATVGIDLTTAGCPLKDTLTRDVTAAALTVDGVDDARVVMGVMSAEQRAALRTLLRGTDAEPVVPFAQPGSLTKVFAIASGKGGVGKSSVTANLAVAMAAAGLRVGVVDADI